MKKRDIFLILLAFLLLVAVFVGSLFLLLGNKDDKPQEKEPISPEYNIGDNLTVPDKEINQQINEIDKTGFDSQTQYWIDKLKTVCDVESELNNGKTLEVLCQKYFPDEYRDYKSSTLLGDDDLEEFPEENVAELYDRCLKMAEEYNFIGIIQAIEQEMKTYKFTMPYNYKIGDIYKDATIMNSFDNMNSATRVKNISLLKTPELMLIAAVDSTGREQCCMAIDRNSICLPSLTRINIQKVEEYTIPRETSDYDGKLMNMYFNSTADDLEVVKITFTVNFDLSGLKPSDFGSYFEKSNITSTEDNSLCIYDENGEILYYLGRYSISELQNLKAENPEYAETIDAEINRRKEESQNTSSNQQTNNSDIGEISGMIKPDESQPEYTDNKEYDLEKFESFKSTVYEAYIPKYKLANNVYNRLYAIRQITNTEITCNVDIQYYRNLNHGSQSFLNYIYENKWSNLNPIDDNELGEAIRGEGVN